MKDYPGILRWARSKSLALRVSFQTLAEARNITNCPRLQVIHLSKSEQLSRRYHRRYRIGTTLHWDLQQMQHAWFQILHTKYGSLSHVVGVPDRHFEDLNNDYLSIKTAHQRFNSVVMGQFVRLRYSPPLGARGNQRTRNPLLSSGKILVCTAGLKGPVF